MTAEQTAIVNTVVSNLNSSIRRIEQALASNPAGYVHVWPKHWIAVKFNNDVCHGCDVVGATVVSQRDKRWFVNGNHERTVLMSRRDALQGALEHAKTTLASFEAQLAA